MPVRTIAQKYSVNKATISRRSKKESWAVGRTEAAYKSRTQCVQKIADASASNAVKLEQARRLAINVILANLGKLETMQGSRVTTRTEDKRGNPVTVDFDLNDMVSALEKLQRMGGGNGDVNPVTIVWTRTK